MKCDCCHKRKRIKESFAKIETQDTIMYLCVDCNNLAYKLRDDSIEKDTTNFEKHLKELSLREKKSSVTYLKWKSEFLIRLKENFDNN